MVGSMMSFCLLAFILCCKETSKKGLRNKASKGLPVAAATRKVLRLRCLKHGNGKNGPAYIIIYRARENGPAYINIYKIKKMAQRE